jgi:hypothetical protein
LNPITHALLGWEVACVAGVGPRDRALVTAVSVAPDLDGLGAIVDIGRSLVGASPTAYYATYHHWVLHGLLGAVLSVGVACLLSSQRLVMLALSALVFHLHLLCDLVGSGGASTGSVWPIHYLEPFSGRLSLEWSGQWQLNAWPNVLLTCILLGASCTRAVRTGVSPTSLLGRRIDGVFVTTLQRWFGYGRSQS